MSYNPAYLDSTTTTDIDWALAWTRFLLRDTSDTETYSDTELLAVIKRFGWTYDSVTYYRPHHAAASLIENDPDRAVSESVLGVSMTARSPAAAAAAVRASGRWVDDLIETATDGVRPPSGRTLAPTW